MLRQLRSHPRKATAHPLLAFSGVPGVSLRETMTKKRIASLNAPLDDSRPVPWLDQEANNHGFYSPHDFPWQPDPADFGGDTPFVVVILGGSVAHWMNLIAAEDIRNGLKERGVGKGRPLAVLNAASGGFKQPQALLTLAMLLAAGQPIDAVILVDGFNEVALSHSNWLQGYDPLAPSAEHLRMAGTKVPSSAGRHDDNKRHETMELVVEHWGRCTRLTHDLCGSQDIPIGHVVQPNQYYSGKTFTAEERRIALSDTSPYRIGVESGYPLLADKTVTLDADGYNVADATGLFDNVTETVYADNCCHYNVPGNTAIARAAVTVLDQGINATTGSAPAGSEGLSSIKPARPRRSNVGNRPKATGDTPPDDVYPLW